MNADKIHLIYFSPTGTTQSVLRLMAGYMDVEAVEHDYTPFHSSGDELAFGADDFVVFGFPVYRGRVPELFRERLCFVKGIHTPAAIVATYGNREYGDALLEMRDIAITRGFVPIIAAAVVTEHNVIRSVAAGRPDEKDKDFLKRYCVEIAKCRTAFPAMAASEAPLAVPGEYPYCSIKPPWKSGWISTTSACTACGLCAAECPVEAIPSNNPRETQKNCISCMRCTRICPCSARQLKKILTVAGNIIMTKSKRVRKEPELFTSDGKT